MKKKTIPELDKLFFETGRYRRSDDFKDLLKFIKKFPRVASYNAMLLHVQRPGSQYVATASEWLRRFNRRITPGARPLVILRPFGPVSFVFELSDTYGEDPFPEQLLNPFKVEGKISEATLRHLTDNLKTDGIFYSESDHGASSAGFIGTGDRARIMSIRKGDKEIWVKVLYDLVVNRHHPRETKYATVLHELGHLYCGHLGTPNEKWWNDRRRLDINIKEFEAESVCWLVCERMGIQNPSAEYLSGYLDNNNKIPDVSIETILKAVNMIETMIKGTKTPRKEIIVEDQ